MGGCVSSHQKPSGMKMQVLFGSNDHIKPHLVNDAKSKWSPPSKSTPSFTDFGMFFILLILIYDAYI